MRVLAHDPYLSAPAIEAGGAEATSWDEMLAASDMISIHLPLTKETCGLFGTSTLASMKPGSLLVNTSRGAIVDEQALIAALGRGHLAGAALDVFEHEPLPADHPLVGRSDVVMTPHSAAFTEEALAEVRTRAIDDVLRVLAGRSPAHPVPEAR
jgi:D-3-phosphoglycerate dehydrogenase / 2-oxoglutarate reductase